MIENFIARNLNKTVIFLLKSNLSSITAQIHFDNKEALAISYQNNNKFTDAYLTLHCSESIKHPYKIVFCNCCSSRRIFLRNNNLILSESEFLDLKSVIKIQKYRNDPFLAYLEAKATKNVQLLIEVLNEIPEFFEAYLLLSELSDDVIKFDNPISIIYYLYIKILKDVDVAEYVDEILENVLFSKSDCGFLYNEIIENNLNIVAAYFYCCGSTEKAEKIFNRILTNSFDLNSNLIDISYLHLYSIILYNKSDPNFATFIENLNNFYKNQFETIVSYCIYQTSIGNYEKSIDLLKRTLKKSYKEDKSTFSDIYCLIAHNYIKIQDFTNAQLYFEEALKLNFVNFRILYVVSQGFFTMQKYESALWFCKRALEKKEDGGICKLLGRVYMGLEKYNKALECLKMAEKFQEYDSLLYLAEVYKKLGKPEKSLELYKKYVQVGNKNREVVVKYLIDYFEEQGDVKNALQYREMMPELQ